MRHHLSMLSVWDRACRAATMDETCSPQLDVVLFGLIFEVQLEDAVDTMHFGPGHGPAQQ